MSTNAYIGYIGGALVVIPIGALIARLATAWLARFKPRYLRALLSTLVAYVLVNLVGFALQQFGGFAEPRRGLQLLVGVGLLSCCHIYFLRSESSERLTPGKAVLVSLCQVVGAAIVFIAVLWIVAGVKRLVA